MKKITLISLVACSCLTAYFLYSYTLKSTENNNMDSQNHKNTEEKKYRKALVNYDDFKNLVIEVEKQRAERLISFDVFKQMSKEKNVVILDTRSDFRFNRKHIKGAIHLDFTDFTQENLFKLIPDKNTKILIYCNNNFIGNEDKIDVDFASKVAIPIKDIPDQKTERQILENRKPIMLALNIPTYINLYGYGYRNIYELDELVNVNDPRVKFEGTEVK